MKLTRNAQIQIGLFVIALLVLTLLLPWKVAVAVYLALFIHESGHVIAMKALGGTVKGIYCIPMVGMVAVGGAEIKKASHEAIIAMAGPVLGLLPVAILYGWYRAAGYDWLQQSTMIAAIINLFNLLPINPLDGGRIAKCIGRSIDPVLGLMIVGLGCTLVIYMAITTLNPVLVLVSFVSFKTLEGELAFSVVARGAKRCLKDCQDHTCQGRIQALAFLHGLQNYKMRLREIALCTVLYFGLTAGHLTFFALTASKVVTH